MEEILRFDGVELPLNADSIKTLLSEKRNQLNEMQLMSLGLSEENRQRVQLLIRMISTSNTWR